MSEREALRAILSVKYTDTHPLEQVKSIAENALKASPWIDIALAPKDGTRVIAGGLLYVGLAHWDAKAEGFRDASSGWIVEPTHFQPLPDPPEGRIAKP